MSPFQQGALAAKKDGEAAKNPFPWYSENHDLFAAGKLWFAVGKREGAFDTIDKPEPAPADPAS